MNIQYVLQKINHFKASNHEIFHVNSRCLLSLTSFNVLADGYNCKTITGIINQLETDLACHIKQAQETQSILPDVTFLDPFIPDFLPASCFYTSLTARLGNRDVTGTFYSGLTANSLCQWNKLPIFSRICYHFET